MPGRSCWSRSSGQRPDRAPTGARIVTLRDGQRATGRSGLVPRRNANVGRPTGRRLTSDDVGHCDSSPGGMEGSRAVATDGPRESGETLRDIADAAGVSHQRVHAIVQQQIRREEL